MTKVHCQNMGFGANKAPLEVIKEGAFGVTYLEKFILVLMVNCKGGNSTVM